MPLTSSQGLDLIAGATKISMKAKRPSPGENKLDASTLELADGSNRVYEDGLEDNGPYGNGGVVVTVDASGYGTKPNTGDTVMAFGTTCYCVESSDDANVGELAGWSASYTSEYEP